MRPTEDDLAAGRAAFDADHNLVWVEPKAKAAGHLISRRASTIETKAVEYLWQGRLARGKHTAFAGEPATNKTTLVNGEIAASITTQREWPCGEGRPPRKGRVLILSAEDDAADTIVPRLIAAGADLDLVEIIDAVRDDKGTRSFNLAVDIERLEQMIAKFGDVDLVTVDPISAYLGKTDSHKNSEVRGVLEPLQKMAERTGVAVASVTHFSKQGGGNSSTKALHKFMGSIAFTAAARMAFAVVEDGDDTNRRLLLHVKNNLAAPPQGLAFTVVQRLVDVAGGSAVHPYVAWDSSPVAMTADDAMAADTGNKSTREEAEEFLAELLAAGPVPQKRVKEDAEGAGLSWATVRRAKDRLGVKAVRDTVSGEFGTGKGQWLWTLKVLNESQDAHIKRVSTLNGSEHLKRTVNCSWCDRKDVDRIAGCDASDCVLRTPRAELTDDEIDDFLKVRQ